MSHKKTILCLCAIILLLGTTTLGSLSAQNIKELTNEQIFSKEYTYTFSQPQLTKNQGFTTVQIQETNAYTQQPGTPLLPVYRETFEFPLGTSIKNIHVQVSEENIIFLDSKINTIQNRFPHSHTNDFQETLFLPLYPLDSCSYQMTGGLNREATETLFINLQINPVQYAPKENKLIFYHSITVVITYQQPLHPFITADEYDMAIITYDSYAKLLEPLVNHKQNHGITTKLVKLRDIYNSVFFPVQGRDNAEKIKYFIKAAKENWGITYVLFVGNFNKIPVRYTHLETDTGGSFEEQRFVSDLYYADIYDAYGNFSSWDTDNDDLFGEWPYPEMQPMEDSVDLVPDVYLGRLACMYRSEVKTMVRKIIEYETSTFGSTWYNRFVVIGGDTFDKSWEAGTDYNEGEEANQKAIEYMTGFTSTKLWASLGNLKTDTILQEINTGAGFVYFVGHGSPKNWATHVNGDYTNWTEGFTNKAMPDLTNSGKYPIVMVGGCHNSEIDVTPFNMVRGILNEGLFGYFSADENGFGSYWLSNWVLECWSWVFVKQPHAGAIASIGSIGYGGVNIGDANHNSIPDCIEGADGWFETQFFRLYNQDHIDLLGATYSQTVTDYIHNFEVFTNRYDAKIVQTHILLGDPSLKIGGYE